MVKRALNNLSNNLQQFGFNVSLKRTSDADNGISQSRLAKRYKGSDDQEVQQENHVPALQIANKFRSLGRAISINVRQQLAHHDPQQKQQPNQQPIELEIKLRESTQNESRDILAENRPVKAPTLGTGDGIADCFAFVPDAIAAEVEISGEEEEEVECLFVEPDFTDQQQLYTPPKSFPLEIEDYDRQQLGDIDSEPNYAFHTFEYYFRRELDFVIPNYIKDQPEVTKFMRSILIDWIVEVQEVFQLNHETIYQSVKIVDLYLSKCAVLKSELQLLGCTAMFIASKYDERVSHSLESFVFVCDKACTKKDVIRMEKQILNLLSFDIGMPLSYRFLRRFARVSHHPIRQHKFFRMIFKLFFLLSTQCARFTMEMLTFSRYILEMTLMEYDFVTELDSKMAAASLLLAIKSKADINVSWVNEGLICLYSYYLIKNFFCRTRHSSSTVTIRSKTFCP